MLPDSRLPIVLNPQLEEVVELIRAKREEESAAREAEVVEETQDLEEEN